jgi:Na+/proline symporter
MQRPASQVISDTVRDAVARAVAAVGLAGFALIHLLDLPDTMSGSSLIGWLYIAAITGAVGLAGALIWTSDTRVWLAAAGLVSAVIVAYVLSRTTGIPQDGEDIGNWGEPLGIAMLFVGGSILCLTGGVLGERARRVRRSAVSERPIALRRDDRGPVTA